MARARAVRDGFEFSVENASAGVYRSAEMVHNTTRPPSSAAEREFGIG
jgi:hypothetical protein